MVIGTVEVMLVLNISNAQPLAMLQQHLRSRKFY